MYKWPCEGALGYMVVVSLQFGAKVMVAMRLGLETKSISKQSTL